MNINLNPISGMPGESFDLLNKWMGNPVVLLIVLIVFFVYYGLFSSTGMETPMISNATGSTRVFEIMIWGILLTVILANGLRYFYGSNIVASIKNLFGKEPEIEVNVTQPEGVDMSDLAVPEMSIREQVFHIPDNKYTYNDAKAVCAAYGGKLADYNEIKDAYDKGADWCSYGWSNDQMVYFPTQEEKWKKLQEIEGHEHSCGRPGINGGYIANPNARFGVNCYGYKPEISPYEAKLMRERDGLPVSEKDLKFNKLVEEWKHKIPNILIAPFNNANWSSF